MRSVFRLLEYIPSGMVQNGQSTAFVRVVLQPWTEVQSLNKKAMGNNAGHGTLEIAEWRFCYLPVVQPLFMDCASVFSYHQGSACRPLEEEVVL